MSTPNSASAATEEMHACNSSSELLPKRLRNRNSSCATELSVLTNELLAKDLYASNVRLKIYFYFLLLVNIALMAAVGGLAYVHFLGNTDSSDHRSSKGIIHTSEDETSPRGGETERLFRAEEVSPGFTGVINCATLRYKLKVEVPGSRVECSLNDLVDALIKYVKPREYNEVIHLVGGKPENERNEHYEYTISDWKRDNDTRSSLKYHMTKSSITIPSDGFYFLYCRLSFSSNVENKTMSRTNIKHSIRIKPNNQRFQKFVTVTTPTSDIDFSGNSYIQRVAKFRRGEELKVTVSRAGKLQYDANDVTGNYFGMFKL